MLGKIEEISKETKELGGSSRDVRPAMAVAKFQPVLQRKQRGRMKKLVVLKFICFLPFDVGPKILDLSLPAIGSLGQKFCSLC